MLAGAHRRLSRRLGSEAADLAWWVIVSTLGLAGTAVAVHLHVRLGTAGAPFTGRYRLKLDPATALAPAVAVGVIAASARHLPDRLGWRQLLAAAYAAALGWTLSLAAVDGRNGLAAPVTNPGEYFSDVKAVAGHPAAFLRAFVADSAQHAVATRQHPPGPVLALWALTRAGLTDPVLIGLLIAAVGALSVPLVLTTMRSVCGESAARRLTPILVLAPYAVWVAVSMDAVTSTLAAGMVAAGVLASEPRRRALGAGWAVISGLLVGLAALFSYATPWLAFSVVCVYFVRRRPLLVIVTGIASLAPLALAQAAGFSWAAGLTAAQADFSERVEPQRSAVVWGLVSLVVLILACGPAVVASARKMRRSPGWPFLVGAGLAVGFAVGAGLARGEMEHAWVPYFPWLLVAAVAPQRRGEDSTRTPLWLVGAGALGAVTLEAVLRTAW